MSGGGSFFTAGIFTAAAFLTGDFLTAKGLAALLAFGFLGDLAALGLAATFILSLPAGVIEEVHVEIRGEKRTNNQ